MKLSLAAICAFLLSLVGSAKSGTDILQLTRAINKAHIKDNMGSFASNPCGTCTGSTIICCADGNCVSSVLDCNDMMFGPMESSFRVGGTDRLYFALYPTAGLLKIGQEEDAVLRDPRTATRRTTQTLFLGELGGTIWEEDAGLEPGLYEFVMDQTHKTVMVRNTDLDVVVTVPVLLTHFSARDRGRNPQGDDDSCYFDAYDGCLVATCCDGDWSCWDAKICLTW